MGAITGAEAADKYEGELGTSATKKSLSTRKNMSDRLWQMERLEGLLQAKVWKSYEADVLRKAVGHKGLLIRLKGLRVELEAEVWYTRQLMEYF